MKKIFIIGSNSFAGSNFIDLLLNKKFKVYGISRSSESNKIYLKYKQNKNLNNFNFIKLDINKNYKKLFKLFEKIKPNYVINFAAQGMVDQSWDNPKDWYHTNIIGNTRVVEFLKKKTYLKRYINFSTPEVYGNYLKKINSKTSFDPSTPYALSRMTFDIHLKLLGKVNNFPFIITRAANIYGPGQQLYRLIPKAIICNIKNTKFILDGSGETLRSFIYMDDVSTALFKILLNGKIGNSYNISTRNLYSIKNILKIISSRFKNNNFKFKNVKDRRFKDKIYNLDSNLLRKSLKWNENFSLIEGIDMTIEWVKQNLNYLNKQNKKYVHKK